MRKFVSTMFTLYRNATGAIFRNIPDGFSVHKRIGALRFNLQILGKWPLFSGAIFRIPNLRTVCSCKTKTFNRRFKVGMLKW